MPELLKLLLTSEPNIAVATLIKRCVFGEKRALIVSYQEYERRTQILSGI
jgi:hypothetical protein